MADTPYMPFRVERKWPAGAEVAAFRLVPMSASLPPFSAGSHVRLRLPAGDRELVRQYSLTNGPADTDAFCIGVKREPASRGGSSFMHDHVVAGDILEVGMPVDAFPLRAGARETMLLAGGIGVTPLLSMARHLAHRGERLRMHYFCRSREHAAFIGELARLDPAGERIRFHLGLDPVATAAVLAEALVPVHGKQVYVCGPAPFLLAAQQLGHALEPGSLHFEKFSNDEVQAPRSAMRSFQLCTRHEGPFEVGPEDTMLAVLRRHGIEVDTACEQGVCGTCMTRVLEGVPEHHDVFLTQEERACNHHVLPCVSRAASDFIRLDL